LYPSLSRRLLLTGLPALLVALVVVSTVWGEHGLVRRYQLHKQLEHANDRLAATERENQRLLRELTIMDEDPVVLERIVADELAWGPEGSVLYRFQEPQE
jgi:cell division protein FtsB